MRRRPIAVLALAGLATPVMANGAMGLGLEQWDPRYWMAYVAVTIAFEAWYIGCWLKMAPPKAITISIIANLFTGIGCGLMGCCAVFLHYPLVGSSADPNPFLSAVALLAVWAVPSALVEALFWRRMFIVGRDQSKGEWNVLGRTALAHLISIPIGLTVLLIPERPYLGMETWATYHRRTGLQDFTADLSYYIDVNGHLPKAETIDQMLAEVPRFRDEPLPFDRDLTFYKPEFSRFDTGDTRRHPYTINIALKGRKIDPNATNESDQFEWYLYPSADSRKWGWGIQVEPKTGQIRRAKYPEGTLSPF